MNLVDYKKAAAILGYSPNAGSVYEVLEPLASHMVNGKKHWEEQDVQALAATRPSRKKAKVNGSKFSDIVSASLLLGRMESIERKLDVLLRELGSNGG